MERAFKVQLLMVIIAICMLQSAYAQITKESSNILMPRHSIELSPMTPIGNVYSLQCNYRMTKKNEFIAGLSFVNIRYENIGRNNAPGIILGYRRFLWKNLHIQYELWPGYDIFYEQNVNKHYKGFQLWNEFRLGYQFNFKVKSQYSYVSIQWPLGFYLKKGNKPQSFVDYEKVNRFFYNVPLVYVGLRF